MQRKPLIALTLLAYLGAWAATATFGISQARSAVETDDCTSFWSASSPAPFWIIGDYNIGDLGVFGDGGAKRYHTHFIWVPGSVFKAHTRDGGWPGCGYPIF